MIIKPFGVYLIFRQTQSKPENDAYFWSHIPIFKGEILEPLPGGSCFPWNEVFWASMVASFGWPWLLPFGREGVTENDRDINTQSIGSKQYLKETRILGGKHHSIR